MRVYTFDNIALKLFNSTFYPCDAMLVWVIAIVMCLSIHLSVCLSVTSRYCVKKNKANVMISSPSGSPVILVFLIPNFIPTFKQGRGG